MASPRKPSTTRSREEVDSPEIHQTKRHEAEGEGIGIIAVMQDLLRKDQAKRDSQHVELLSTMSTLQGTVQGLQVSIETERTTRETEIKEINARLKKVEDDKNESLTQAIKDEIERKVAIKVHTDLQAHTSKADDDDANERDKNVIVSGFDADTDSEIIINKIEEFLKVGTRRTKVCEVRTFSDPSSTGVIEFTTPQAKKGFFKKIRGQTLQLDNGKDMRFHNHNTYEERVRNATLLQIRYQLIQECSTKKSDIKIEEHHGTVKVKNKVVARFCPEGNTTYETCIIVIKDKVEQFMTEWKEKRNRTAE